MKTTHKLVLAAVAVAALAGATHTFAAQISCITVDNRLVCTDPPPRCITVLGRLICVR
jgi:hypothetical protein